MILAGGFVLGEVLGLRSHTAFEVTAAAVLTAMLAGLCIAVGNQRNSVEKISRRNGGRSLWLWLLPVFLCAGFLRAGQERMQCERELELGLDGTRQAVEGTVDSWDMQESGEMVLILKDCRELRRLMVWMKESPGVPVQVGMRVRVAGKLKMWEGIRNPGEFDRRLYYRSRKLTYQMSADSCEIIGVRRTIADVWKEKLARLRLSAGNILDQIADEQEAGICRAILLGERAGMNSDLQDLYQRNGIAHILAVSGLHLSFISLAVYGGLRVCGFGYGAAGVVSGSILAAYVVLSGASASALRACLMACCGFAAACLGRTPDPMSSWSLALLVLLWDSPYLLLQSGVQLSFGAIAGIAWLAPAFCCDKREENQKKIRQTLWTSVSMQLVTLPILLYHFFQYPLYGIVLNFLVVPLMGCVVASGVGGIFLGAFQIASGRFAIGSACLLLRWFTFCCRMCENLPFTLWTPGRPVPWKIGVYYGVLAGLVGMPKGKLPYRRFILLIPVILWMVWQPVKGLEVTFLDVGQGDGICIRSEQAVILVDGGSSDRKKLGSQSLIPVLKSQGITTIDAAVVSHADQDHISGLQELLETEEIQVKCLVMPACGQLDEAYENLVQLIQQREGQVSWMEKGQKLTIGELYVTCLYPDGRMDFEDRNDHSLVLRVDDRDFHMLLTGDMTMEGEETLLKQLPPGTLSEIQVLKVSHHGSESSTSEEWVRAVSPVWSVVSYGKDNRYGHPSDRVLGTLRAYGSEVFETAEAGAVTLVTDGKIIRWKTQREK